MRGKPPGKDVFRPCESIIEGPAVMKSTAKSRRLAPGTEIQSFCTVYIIKCWSSTSLHHRLQSISDDLGSNLLALGRGFEKLADVFFTPKISGNNLCSALKLGKFGNILGVHPYFLTNILSNGLVQPPSSPSDVECLGANYTSDQFPLVNSTPNGGEKKLWKATPKCPFFSGLPWKSARHHL